ncbi:hypothetical protein [Thermomonospora umbrina]|uniref:hypothetical protein n=1 Tax=Thermomonospora umbrina TaxID=111806 RepID=UPI000E222C7D|nr:hypothetical protein [Thermomonospora umbrina]
MLDAHGQRFHAASEALSAGGAFAIWDGLVPASQLATTYSRRRRLTVKRATPTMALDETVDILTDLGDTPLRLGRIDTSDGGWTHMIFLSADASAVIACTSVRRPSKAGPIEPCDDQPNR